MKEDKEDSKQIKKYKNNFEITPKDLAREIYREKIEDKRPLLMILSVFILGCIVATGYFLGPLMAFFVTLLVLGFAHVLEKLIFHDYYSKVVHYKNLFDGEDHKGNIEKITYKNIKEMMNH